MFVVALPLLWVAADWTYSRRVTLRMARWEATQERDDHGVQIGHAAYTLGDGDPALLLIHGIADSPRAYAKMAPRLARQGFTCRVMRLPGFAEPVESLASATRDDWTRAVAAELADLTGTHGSVAVVAHSLGAAVAIHCALAEPPSIDALVLLAPLIDVSRKRSPLLSARAWHHVTRRALHFTTITETPFPIDARDPEERDFPDRCRFSPVGVFDEVFALIDGNRHRADELRMPLMTVVSPHDRVIDRDAAERFHAEAGSAVKILRLASDAGHALPRDHGWEERTDAIAEFARASATGN